MDAREFLAARRALGLSQAALAQALGVDQATVSRWESGKARIPGTVELALQKLKESLFPMPANGRPAILVADPIAAEGIELLRSVGTVEVRTGLREDELAAIIPDFAALVVRSETKVTRRIIEAGRNLVVIGRAGVGVDNIDLEAATERGVIVVNAPQGNTIAAAEHTIALLLALARHIPAADASMHEGRWERSRFIGTEVRGKVLGIVGLGKIGTEVARRAIALEMRVLAYDPYVPVERAEQLGVQSVDFDTLLRESDFISLHAPMTQQTQGLIGAAELARMKPGVRIINVARGGIVDEAALAEALRDGRVAGAAVDVFTQEPPPPDHPLRHAPNAILTPHLGASTAEAQERVALDVAEQIVEVLAGRPARYAVNAPALPPETLRVLGPYMRVGEAIGAIATQLVRGTISRIEIDLYGEVAEHDTTPIKASVIKGLLKPISEENVNIVNASLVAQSRGWVIQERLNSSHEVYVNLIHLSVHTSDSVVDVAGTTHRGQLNLVKLMGMDIDLVPEPGSYLLVCDNEDRPGMIGRLGTMLGQFDINISSMQVGRRERRGRAVMVVGLDERPTDEQLAQIEAIDGIYNVRLVEL
ncbi:D-3-phosphoglycerate dehydrogenase [bacterium HR29]|jgi:D-3-phosphoglycerate dehydrogenase|nr:D-3-phosphoglycerate dehydrogenase [bacterium HR29]